MKNSGQVASSVTLAATVGLCGCLVQPAQALAAQTQAAQVQAAQTQAAQVQAVQTQAVQTRAAQAARTQGAQTARVAQAAQERVQTARAQAAAQNLPSMVAYVRTGDVYVSKGSTEKRLTTGGGHGRPRWAPNGQQLAYLKKGQLWTMKVDGSGQRRLTTRTAAGPSWSPDGKWIAFASMSCTGGPGVYRVSTTTAAAQPEVLFPSSCRGEDLPEDAAVGSPVAGSLNDRLRTDDAVAWSPDGKRVAFRGGDCESTYDACLSIGTVASGEEKTVAAFGGGGSQNSGFAVVPSWRSDGVKLSWTAYQEGETPAETEPVHLVEYDTVTGQKRNVGGALDRELSYVDAGRAVITSQNKGGSWLTVLGLATGTRTLLRSGSQPSVQPLPR